MYEILCTIVLLTDNCKLLFIELIMLLALYINIWYVYTANKNLWNVCKQLMDMY